MKRNEQNQTGIAPKSRFSFVLLRNDCFFDVVQWRHRLPRCGSFGIPAGNGHSFSARGARHECSRATALDNCGKGDTRGLAARRTSSGIVVVPWGFAGNQSGPDLGCVPFVFINGSRKWIALQRGRA